jgi:hypothetical protein
MIRRADLARGCPLSIAAMTGVDPKETKIALGEFGGISPSSIWPHVADRESGKVNTDTHLTEIFVHGMSNMSHKL